MTGIISTEHPNFKDFFGNVRVAYEIPEYQREYSWKVTGEAEVDVLWNDLNDYLEEENLHNYFMGPVIVYKKTGTRGLFDKYDIADGQQRLVTLSILACALRDTYIFLHKQISDLGTLGTSEYEILSEFKLKGEELQKNFIYKQFIQNEETNKTFALKLNNEYYDETCFKLLRVPGKGNEPDWWPGQRHNHRVVSAYKHLRFEKFEKLTTDTTIEEARDRLGSWYELLMNKLEFLLVKTDGIDNAFKLFETINTRGRPLTIADLTKNLLYSEAAKHDRLQAGQNVTGEVREKWKGSESVRSIISKDSKNISSFLLRYWNSCHFPKTTKKKFYKSVSSEIKIKDKDDFLEFLDTLIAHAKYHQKIVEPVPPARGSTQLDINIYTALQNLNRLGVAQHVPLLMASMDTYGINDNDLLRIIKFIETVFVRWNVAKDGSPSRMENNYVKWAVKLREKGSSYIEDMVREAEEIIQCDDEMFENMMAKVKMADSNRIKYFFRKIERKLNEREDEVDNLREDSLIDVEHIMPKTIAGVEEWHVNWDESDHDDFLNRLGNLTLLLKRDNIAVSNSPFEEKRRTYSQSALEITKGEEHPCCIKYNNRTDWAKIDINQRQRALAQMAVEIWTFE